MARWQKGKKEKKERERKKEGRRNKATVVKMNRNLKVVNY